MFNCVFLHLVLVIKGSLQKGKKKNSLEFSIPVLTPASQAEVWKERKN